MNIQSCPSAEGIQQVLLLAAQRAFVGVCVPTAQVLADVRVAGDVVVVCDEPLPLQNAQPQKQRSTSRYPTSHCEQSAAASGVA